MKGCELMGVVVWVNGLCDVSVRMKGCEWMSGAIRGK